MSSLARLACLYAQAIEDKAPARGMQDTCLPVFLTSFRRLYP